MEDDWVVVPETGMTWMADRINHDRSEISPLHADQSNLTAEPGAAGGGSAREVEAAAVGSKGLK
eukprot:3237006-Rhodomonas_salina.1